MVWQMTNPALTVTVSIVLSALILLNQIMGLRRLVAHPEKIQGILPQLALKLFPQDDVERLAFFALVATVALCEELIYRGFVQRVFQDWSRGSVVCRRHRLRRFFCARPSLSGTPRPNFHSNYRHHFFHHTRLDGKLAAMRRGAFRSRHHRQDCLRRAGCVWHWRPDHSSQ